MLDFKKSHYLNYGHTHKHQHTKTLCQHPETQQNGNVNTWSDNKVDELATVCLPWHWTKTLVWCEDVDISISQLCC
jgi:hypothetical protein